MAEKGSRIDCDCLARLRVVLVRRADRLKREAECTGEILRGEKARLRDRWVECVNVIDLVDERIKRGSIDD